MNTIFEFFNSLWLHALGYTLIHSVWQGCAVLAVLLIILRITPTKLSNARYVIASIGLIMILALSVGTFFYVYSPTNNLSSLKEAALTDPPTQTFTYETMTAIGYYFEGVKSFIHSNIPIFLIIWILGACVFCLRIVTGLVYVGQIRDNSYLIQGEWSERVQQLARQLQIRRWISLAESTHIQAPIVVGYLKPMILIPIGMCTNFSTEQLETIFLHELMHIRRKDYLINLIQSFTEAIFFFNPVVWIISGIMRREREHCCDDAVVEVHGNVRAFAHALASLEEVRLSKPELSISLAENKNQLLNRIKRLMEKSVKNYSGRERILPALLLVIGLICASWISIQTGKKEVAFVSVDNKTIVSDTTKKVKKHKTSKKAADAQKETSSLQKDKTTDTDVVEKSEDERSVLPAPPVHDFHFHMPPLPDVEAMLPPVPDINMMLRDFDLPEMAWRSGEDWEEFGKEFEEKFKAKFGDFYQANEKDIQQIIDDVQQKVDSGFQGDWGKKMQDLAFKQQEWARTHNEEWDKNSEDHQKRWEEQHKEFEKNHERFERKMKAFEENTKRFEEELRTELIKDGYLTEDEKLTNMHWNNGSIEINGKKIKASDEKKYNELHNRFFEIE